jgi:acyl-CoA thioesterase I
MSMKFLKVGLLAASVACSAERNIDRASADSGAAVGPQAVEASDTSSTTTTDAAKGKVTVLFFGTSLTAGYGLDPSIAFPRLVAQKAEAAGTPIEAINAGLSGETSAGAVRRIEWTLKKPVDVVVLETGGNDALRALNADSLKGNLTRIVSHIRSAQPQAKIILAVMEAPPNLGAQYTSAFKKAYRDVAAEHNLTLMPFLLDKVAGITELNQADGVHPNEKGERIVADNVWRVLEPIVREVSSAR